jgi:N-acetyl-anhydromuramyl-L-alanine amidase AmpD
MININIEDYPATCKNYISTETKKTQIIVNISNRKDHNHLIRLANKDNGVCKEWNTYTIARNGEIFEHYDPKYYSKYLGIDAYNKNNISIVLENMGALMKGDHIFNNQLNEVCEGEITEMKYYGYYYWETITDQQMDSLAELSKHLCEKYGINLKCVEFDFYHKDINKSGGIVFMSNYYDVDTFCVPHFNIPRFIKQITI